MQTLKLGFIGAGFIAKFHAVALTQVRGIELSGVHSLVGAEEFAGFAKENGLGDCKVCSTVAELCNNCDAVAITAPNFVRIELAEQIVDYPVGCQFPVPARSHLLIEVGELAPVLGNDICVSVFRFHGFITGR